MKKFWFILSFGITFLNSSFATPVYLVVTASTVSEKRVNDDFALLRSEPLNVENEVTRLSEKKLMSLLLQECDQQGGLLAKTICVTDSDYFTHSSVDYDANHELFRVLKIKRYLSGKAYCRVDSEKISHYKRFVEGEEGNNFECLSRITN